MKTAMTELIERMPPNFFTEEEKRFWIEKEKEQIRKAFNGGYRDGFGDAQGVTENENENDIAINYYDYTFGKINK